MKKYDTKLSAVVRAFRAYNRISQADLAAKCGVSIKCIYDLENATHPPRWDTLVQLGKTMGRNPKELSMMWGEEK